MLPNSSKQRLSYIDIAKGILILMVIYSHTDNIAIGSNINNKTISFVADTRFFIPFFMPAFFIIAGMCSNYNKKFKNFVISNAKALLIPAILLIFVRIFLRYLFTGTFSQTEWSRITSPLVIFNLGNVHWFLTALFTTKLLFYAFLRVVRSYKIRILLALTIHLIGITFVTFKGTDFVYFDFYFYQHSLIYLLYLEIGYDIANNVIKSPGFYINTSIFFIIYMVYLLLGRKIPFVTYYFNVPILDIIPHLIMSVCGSLMTIEFAQIINKEWLLEEFGKHSLVIYCLHFQFMLSFYEIFREPLNKFGGHYTLTSLLILYIFTAFGCLLISYILNTKYLKWILGKF